MKIKALTLCICVTLLISCGGVEGTSQKRTAEKSEMQNQSPEVSMVNREAAVAIAKKDAVNAGVSLKLYEIVISEEAKEWRILFQLKDKTLNGGGPEYVIDKETGRILGRKFYQ